MDSLVSDSINLCSFIVQVVPLLQVLYTTASFQVIHIVRSKVGSEFVQNCPRDGLHMVHEVFRVQKLPLPSSSSPQKHLTHRPVLTMRSRRFCLSCYLKTKWIALTREAKCYISKNQHFLFHLIQSYHILFVLFWG